MIIPVILSGGSGTRLWPLSRKLYPKQFINLINETTLFQDTILRLPDNIEKPLIICNEEHRFLVDEQLRQINQKTNGIILEPNGKNTAPAIALAALHELNNNHDSLLFVLSADHIIQDINQLKLQKTLLRKINSLLLVFCLISQKQVMVILKSAITLQMIISTLNHLQKNLMKKLRKNILILVTICGIAVCLCSKRLYI